MGDPLVITQPHLLTNLPLFCCCCCCCFFFFSLGKSLSLSLSLFSLASLFHHRWPRSGRAWAHLDFLVVIRRLSSKDGCRFVLGQARDGFLSVGFGSFVEIPWWLYLQRWRNNGGWLIFCLWLIGGKMVDLGFSYLRGLHVYGYEISGFMTLWVWNFLSLWVAMIFWVYGVSMIFYLFGIF